MTKNARYQLEARAAGVVQRLVSVMPLRSVRALGRGLGRLRLAVEETESGDRTVIGLAHSRLREPECRYTFTLKSLAAFSPRSFRFRSGPRSARPATVETESGHMQSKWA